jgi:hypothetical protein
MSLEVVGDKKFNLEKYLSLVAWNNSGPTFTDKCDFLITDEKLKESFLS